MFSKNLFLLFIGSWVWFSGMQAMEAWGLENVQAMEVNITEETQENTVQSFNDDDLITILFTNNIAQVNDQGFEQGKVDEMDYKTEDNIIYEVAQEIMFPTK